MAITKREIYETARNHHDRYLLPKSPYWSGDKEVNAACEDLVKTGHARWLDGGSSYFPGIQLTGKPIESK